MNPCCLASDPPIVEDPDLVRVPIAEPEDAPILVVDADWMKSRPMSSWRAARKP